MRLRRLLRTLVAATGALIATAGPLAGPASAHPLGNFTVNTYSGLSVGNERVDVEFVVDQAEIPTFQARADIDGDGDGTIDAPEGAAYRRRECARMAGGVRLAVDGREATLAVRSANLEFRPGQAGLTTLRLTCSLRAGLAPTGGVRRITYSSSNYVERVGWREITAVGDRTTLVATDVAAQSVSERLTRYPDDLLSSPLDQRTADVQVRPGGPAAGDASAGPLAAAPLPRGVDAATQAFTGFIGRQQLNVGFVLLAMLGSGVLGAIHALAPGHGKTVMAAYLVAERGSPRQALAVGLTVTATHTLGVLALGVAISVSAIVTPERLYPWLGLASGLILAAIGVRILLRIRRSRGWTLHEHVPAADAPAADALSADALAAEHRSLEPAHAHGGHIHSHAGPIHVHPGPVHSHGGRPHSHGPAAAGVAPASLRPRDVLALGFVGGFLPSPSAVVVLLGAIALGRSWFGVVLVVFYGLGMAATLTAAGLLLLRGRDALDRRMGSAAWQQHPMLNLFSRAVPSATALVIVAVGLFLAFRGGAAI